MLKRIAALPLLILLLTLFTFLAVPTTVAFGADATVIIEENRFADFEFVKTTGTKNVLITVTNLHDALTYKDFEKYIRLESRYPVQEVDFDYLAFDETALIMFTLKDKTVYLTLSKDLEKLPKVTLNTPEIKTDVSVTLDNASYIAATSSARSGTINLEIKSKAENESLITSAKQMFNGFTILNSLNFYSKMSITKTDTGTSEEFFYGTEGQKLKLKIAIPDYRENYKYALLSDLSGQGVFSERLQVEVLNGYAYVNASLVKNGDFCIITYMPEALPWWAILLITGGGAALFAGLAIGFAIYKKKQNTAAKLRLEQNADTKNDATSTETATTKTESTTTAKAKSTTHKDKKVPSSASTDKADTHKNSTTNASTTTSGTKQSATTKTQKNGGGATGNMAKPSTTTEEVQSPLDRHDSTAKPSVIKKSYPQTKKNINKLILAFQTDCPTYPTK